MTDECQDITRVFLKAMALISRSNPLYGQFNEACLARMDARPFAINETDLLHRAQQIIEASEA